jgi:uncharacterized protein
VMPNTGTISFAAAFVAGLAASGHCIAMCGGIAGALAMRSRQASTGSRVATALTYNLARVSSYAIAGTLAGLLGHTLLAAVDVAPLSVAFRVLAGTIMFAVAGRLLFGWRFLDPLEAAGAGLWRRIMPWAGRQGRAGGLRGALGMGLAWGWLPCGMTYSMLLLAATTGSPGSGAAVMGAFGLGTLPSMTTATFAFDRLARELSSRASLRVIAGTLLLLFGLWTAGYALYGLSRHSGAHSGHLAPAAQSSEGHAQHAGH